MQEDFGSNHSVVPPSKLIDQMEYLYEEFQNTNDTSEVNEIKEKANDILVQMVKGLEEDEYEGYEIRPILELHKKICITSK